MESIRTFIAIHTPIEQELMDIWYGLKGLLKYDRVRWIQPDGVHLTLLFIGDTPLHKIDDIIDSIDNQVINLSPFEITISNLGYFGSSRRPIILWFGVEASQQLQELRDIVVREMSYFGFDKDEKPFKPHLTIGRAKSIARIRGVKDFANQCKGVSQRVLVSNLTLYKSELHPDGPVYTPIKIFKLGVGG